MEIYKPIEIFVACIDLLDLAQAIQSKLLLKRVVLKSKMLETWNAGNQYPES